MTAGPDGLNVAAQMAQNRSGGQMNARLVLVAAGMVLAGCSDNAPPTSPAPASVASPAGNWSGSISDAISGDGTAQLTLTGQAPNSLTGTWSMTFKNGD